jgi:glycosyltransferase involved in cell wall biosynthesis
MEPRIRVLYVIQGIIPTGPGRHLFKLLAYRNRDTIDAQVFAFDQCDVSMMTTLEKDFGVQWESMRMRFTNPLTYLRGTPRLLKRIKDYRPHIIQTHHTPIVDWVARLATRWQRVPLNLSRAVSQPKRYHATRRGNFAWWFTHLGDSLTSPLVDYYLPNSVDVSHYLQQVERIPRSKLVVILNGVDTKYFAYDESLRQAGRRFLGLGDQEQLIVNVGPLKPLKRQNHLVEAALDLMPGFPNLRVALVGKIWSASDDRYVQEMRQTIARADQSQKIIFTGELEDVRAVLAAADIYAHPSIVEGSSNAILEAMSMERACVVADIPSCRELVVNGEGGLVVPQNDRQMLACSLSSLLSDQGRRAQMGTKSRQRAVEHYSAYRMCADLEAVYRRGLEEKRVKLPLRNTARST